MDEILKININIVAIIMLGVIHYFAYKTLDITEKVNKAFITLSALTIFELLLESVGCFINGKKGLISNCAAHILYLLIFMVAPVLSYLWFYFIKGWVTPNKREILHRSLFLALPILINFFLVFSTINNGNVFFIDENNLYHRGPLFNLTLGISYSYLLLSFFWIYTHRNKLPRTEILSFLFFGIVPLTGGIIQIKFPNFLFIWSSSAFSLVIVYIFLQKRMIHLDFLTGTWTRESFFGYFYGRLEKSREKVPMIFADIDNLKKINDNFGHIEGDYAIKKAIGIIKGSLRKTDIVSRYGGDEFIILLDSEKKEDLEKIIERIQRGFEKYNRYSKKEYVLSVTFGYEEFTKDYENLEKFIDVIDSKMYTNKKSKKEIFA
ncbi:MAG: diguanylate cyclase [Fusobacteriaceae bacterium]|nr:diguanylate cyclase [Fusobacteriaceae bacterium]